MDLNRTRLIDAMQTVTKMSGRITPLIRMGANPTQVYNEVLQVVAEAPTVDAVEVVHGRWISNMGAALCSACNEECYAMSAMEYDYCPNCGAKMDLEVKDA